MSLDLRSHPLPSATSRPTRRSPIGRQFAATFGCKRGTRCDHRSGDRVCNRWLAISSWKSLAFLEHRRRCLGTVDCYEIASWWEEDAGRFQPVAALARRAEAWPPRRKILVGLCSGLGVLLLAHRSDLCGGRARHQKCTSGSVAMVFFAVAIALSAAVFTCGGCADAASWLRLAVKRLACAGAALGISYALADGRRLRGRAYVVAMGDPARLGRGTSTTHVSSPVGALPDRWRSLRWCLVAAAVHLAGKRDLGASISARDWSKRSHTRA